MSKLSHKQIYDYAIGAGFNRLDAQTATAIAFAESGGDPNAHTVDTDDDSYGLWQINMLGSLGPDRMKRFGLTNPAQLLDPKVNAKAAFAIYKGAGYKFSPWTTFTSGKYKGHLTEDTPAGDVIDTVKDASNLNIGESVNAVGQTLFKGVAGLTGVIVGIVLIVLAVVILLRNQIPAKKLLKAVSS